MASIYNVNPSFVMESSGGGGQRNARCTIGQPPKTKKFRALVIVPAALLLMLRKLDNIVLFEFNPPTGFSSVGVKFNFWNFA